MLDIKDNINIEENNLPSALNKIKKNNVNINEKIKEINNLIKSLDEKVWVSPEKERIDNNLIPYINKRENDIKNGLTSITMVLETAIQRYQDNDLELKNRAHKLAGVDILEE